MTAAETQARDLWTLAPPVACKGLCAESCGPIAMSEGEAAILARRGVTVDFDRETLTCNQLKFGRCQVYKDRPLICRLWGAVPEMACPWGCAPTLTSEQGHQIMALFFANEENQSGSAYD